MKIILAAILLIFSLTTPLYAPFWLYGKVTYGGMSGVGAGKTVKVWFSQEDYDTSTTDQNSEYWYCFYPTYFWKVSCKFTEDGDVYYGEQIINEYFDHDQRVNICVYLAPEK